MKNAASMFSISETIHIELLYTVRKKIIALMVCIYLHRDNELYLSSFDTDQNNKLSAFHNKGKYNAHIEIPSYYLREGEYTLSCGAGISNNSQGSHNPKEVLCFHVHTKDIDCYARSYHPNRCGHFLLGHPWQVKVEPLP